MKLYPYASLLILLPAAAAKQTATAKPQQRNLDECPKDNPLYSPQEACSFSGECGYDPATCPGYTEMFNVLSCTCENNEVLCSARACPAPPGTDGVDTGNGGISVLPCVVENCDVAIALYEPRCGSDGITYDNQALLDCANQCKEPTDADYITEAYMGECKSDPVDPALCDPNDCSFIEIYEPVCGSDEVTYSNTEELDCANKCKDSNSMDWISIAHKGECKKPDPIEADGGISVLPCVVENCDVAIALYEPRCGSDGITYDNQALLDCANQCKEPTDADYITEAYMGECKADPVDPALCDPNDCSFIEIYEPVCGSDEVTYSNTAELECANKCKDSNSMDWISIAYKGECCDRSDCVFITDYDLTCGSDGVLYQNPDTLECANACNATEKEPVIVVDVSNCITDFGLPITDECDINDCVHTMEIDYVCGSDGVTYQNEGALRCANHCNTDEIVYVQGYGKCKAPSCDPDECQWDKMYSPVCGSDKITYPNDRARVCANKCLDKDDLAYVEQVAMGDCKDHDFSIGIAKQTVCDPNNCVYIMTDAPVCGSDGLTYDNDAALACANACKDETDPDYITLKYKGACASPDNDPKYCPAAEPNIFGVPPSCDPNVLTSECLYDSYTCPGYEDYIKYATRCSCFPAMGIDLAGQLICGEALFDCPEPGAVEACPLEKPTNGDFCAFEVTAAKDQICHYNPTHCPGYSDILFQDSCQCTDGFFSCTEIAEAKSAIICAQDPTDPKSKCPIFPPVANQGCEVENLVCPYEPYGCPEDHPSQATFLNTCECMNGMFLCAVDNPKDCAATPEEEAPAVVGGWCFPGDALVDVLHQGPTPMEELKVGDWIRTANDYERIYSFGHKHPDRVAEFVELTMTASGKQQRHQLRLTADHLVYEEQEGFIPASAVKMGHVVIVRNDDSEESMEVTKIRTVKAKGLYAPFTPSGTLLVDGVLASSFIDLSFFGLDSQWVAHTGEFPHRFWCTAVTDCSSEVYDEHGVNYYWGALPMRFVAWLSTAPAWVQYVIQTGLILALSIMSVMEQIWSTGFLTMAVLGLAAVLARRRFATNKKL